MGRGEFEEWRWKEKPPFPQTAGLSVRTPTLTLGEAGKSEAASPAHWYPSLLCT